MKPNHEYIKDHLKVCLQLAKRLDDKLLQYLIAMAIEHCSKQEEAEQIETPAKSLM